VKSGGQIKRKRDRKGVRKEDHKEGKTEGR
jgi:hypothetical protein